MQYVILLIIALIVFSKGKGSKGYINTGQSLKKPSDVELKSMFESIAESNFGPDVAKWAEKIARIETAHFTSGGWKYTNGFGALAGKWSDKYEKYSNGTWKASNGYTYLTFATPFEAIKFLCVYLADGNLKERVVKWGGGASYYNSVSKIKNKFVV